MRLYQSVVSPGLMWMTLLASGLVCASCGGGGGSSPANPFAGSYAGEAVDANNNMTPFNVTVDSRGNLSGTFNPASFLAGFTGTIGRDGIGTLTSNSQTGSGDGTIAFGPLVNGATAVSVNTANFPGGLAALVPNTPLSEWGSQFLGAYVGTITNTTLGATGPAALSVSPTGAVIGFEVMKVNGTLTATPLTGTAVYNASAAVHARSTFSGALTQRTAPNGLEIEGPVTVAGNGKMAESVTLSNGDTTTLALTNIRDIFYPGVVTK